MKAKAVYLSKQGAWTKWNLPERKVSWTELWRMEPVRISFMLRSVYDALPSLSNLHQWGLADDQKCTLCGERGTMAHILSGCKTALQRRKMQLGARPSTTIPRRCTGERTSDKKTKRESTKTIYSVCQARRETKYTIEEEKGILDCAESWKMRTDSKNKLVFSEIVQTTLRPDIVIWSQQSKKLIAIELTVPWKERCQ